MAITKENKTRVIGEYRRAENDTGSPEVQIAVLTHRIILKPESRLRKITASSLVEQIVSEIAVPTLEERAAS